MIENPLLSNLPIENEEEEEENYTEQDFLTHILPKSKTPSKISRSNLKQILYTIFLAKWLNVPLVFVRNNFQTIVSDFKENLHYFFYLMLWNTLFSTLACCIVFWLPSLVFWDINFTAFFQNVLGCFFIAITSNYAKIKFQYYQTYIVYNAMMGGFCSVFTSFGNFIETTDILLSTHYGYVKACLHLAVQLILSFCSYEFGCFVAKKMKKGAKFSNELQIMENEERRLQFEIEKEIEKTELKQKVEEVTQRDLTTQHRYGTFNSSQGSLNQETDDFIVVDETEAIYQTVVNPKIAQLESHLQEQFRKQKRHTSKAFQKRHWIIFSILCAVILCNVFVVLLIQLLQWTWLPSGVSEANYPIFYFEFLVSILMSNLGAIAGRLAGNIGKIHKKQINWSTFRVNIISCILIATAHNVLLLRQYFPLGNTPFFAVVLRRFINEFCGSESSYAGFVEDTVYLYKVVGKRVALQNFLMNIVLCIGIFLILVYSIRIMFFYDIRFFL